ncbi:HlyD family efflux transporter periplasmic adaptor subunit [Butyrivibrio sp. AC2005]|uniref:HlyD family efflux transporter periplasmic adaptor subunit n=1 Tax=Butyrivibrio sp. AC2005 TaxID=1280672 RepID=UPI000403F250|nr:HlyD family efflux transporter periplasmic adaptor subunit [Butyrivibrio sp. AC2005]
MKPIVRNIIAGVVVLSAAGGVFAYSMIPDSVDVEKVVRGSVTQSISEIGLIEADAAVTVYAPASGKLSSVACKVNDSVEKGDQLANYDVTEAENQYNKAGLNVTYYEDNYNAAVADNQKNRSKAATAANRAGDLLAQYVSVEEDRDDISIAQNAKSGSIEQSIKGIEGEIEKQQTNLETEAARLAAETSAYQETHAKQIELEGEIDSIKEKIDLSKDQIKKYQSELSKYQEGSEDYTKYLQLIENENNNLEELRREKDAQKETYKKVKDEANSYANGTQNAKDSVNNIKNSLNESKDALASIPVNQLSTEDYAKYAELSRQLEVIDKQWSTSISEKMAAEEKIVSDAQLKSYEDSVEIARIEEKIAGKLLSIVKNGVTASTSGTVLERLVDDGAITEAGTPLFVIQPDSGYKATLMVSRYDIESVEVGQKAEVIIGAKTYTGSVSVISPVATTTDTSGKPKVKVEITFDDSEAKPTIGLEAQIHIFTKEEKSVLSVSDKAVYTGDDGDYIYVLKGGKAEKRSIVKGASGNGVTEILEGISEGESIITSAMSDEDVGKRFKPGN